MTISHSGLLFLATLYIVIFIARTDCALLHVQLHTS